MTAVIINAANAARQIILGCSPLVLFLSNRTQ